MYQEMEEIMAKEDKTPLFNCAKEFVSFNPFIQINISKLKIEASNYKYFYV